MTFELVDRPDEAVSTELMQAMVDTHQNGKAVRISLEEGVTFLKWQAKVRSKLRADYGLRLRAKFNKATKQVTAWTERDGVKQRKKRVVR